MNIGFESLIDPHSSKTLTRQLEEGIRARIASGYWSPGDVLPSRKTFAEQLGISEFVVRTAFTRLAADHVITLKPGRRCVVRSIPQTDVAGRTVLDVNIEPWYSFGPSVSLFECANFLHGQGCRVRSLALCGGTRDRPYLAPLKDALGTHPDLVIVRSSFSRMPTALQLVSESGCHFVTVGLTPKRSRYSRHVGNVRYDYTAAISALIADCRLAGVKRVAQLDFGQDSYCDASGTLAEAGISVERITCSIAGPHDLDAIVQNSYDRMAQFLAFHPMPDLFLFTDDFLALGAYEAFRLRDIRVPRSVRVVSFANSKSGIRPFGDTAHIAFDPFRDGREIARCALEWFRTGTFGTYTPCCSYHRGASFPVP